MDEKIRAYSVLGYFIGFIDGSLCKNIDSFLTEIGMAFNFPEYYGRNMNELYECINDLEWINEKNYLIVISNAEYFLENESLEYHQAIWRFLDGVRTEWASVPNYIGENEFRNIGDFVILTK